ncbi:MAG: methyltransferase domain-containing protein [Wenyingzhuangia sp.]|jgi:cyclopropane fatty-acyl-phospholipid synthase-like methyltransferase|uniref:class I SAM-dependent methyltransferase n=1 Tax=Wenyingzhuangia sp. TaxID=1964193 RepID=UPI003218EC65
MNKGFEMWDNRYAKDTYAYGTKPNLFFKATIAEYQLNGKMLLPAEGEGRNAVHAAKEGFEVTAFDISSQGKKKALKLAEKEKVMINYEIGNLFDLKLVDQKYDVAALIFAHFPSDVVSIYHHKIADLIIDGGIIILEGFSKNHLEMRNINPKVGGPNKSEMLFSVESIKKDFTNFEIIKLEEVEVDLNEGEFHNGSGKVIRFIGRKISN